MSRLMRKTPQEKKKLSYEKDRRNTYGESPHGSRVSIRLRKRFRNRANRHRQGLALRQLPAPLDDELAEQIEAAVFHYAPKVWNKIPDKPLRYVVEGALEHRRVLRETGGRRRRAGQDHAT